MADPSTSRDDVVVCGAGAAGCAAALAAARAGARVRLVESAARVGGTVADCLIHTLGGLYDAAGGLLNGGLAAELARRLSEGDPPARPRRMGRVWVLSVCPDVYRGVLRRWLAAEPRITLLPNARVCGVEAAGGGVVGLEVERVGQGQLAARGTTLRLAARAVVDATGTAEVVRRLDPSLLQDESRRAAGGLVLRLRGVAPGALAFPRGVAVVRELRAAAAAGALPPACGKAWLDAGVYEDEAYAKLFVPLPDDWCERQDEIVREARRGGDALLGFLRGQPGFGGACVAQVGALGVRDGGRVRGEYRLTGEDVRRARKFPDAACRCAWPIEYWDPEQGALLEYLPDGAWYEVPLRALRVRGAANLWAAGKCLSADREAHASARVAGSCWAMGEAAGRAAAS